MTEQLLRNEGFEDEWQGDHSALYCPVGGTPTVIELPNTLSPPSWLGWYRWAADGNQQPEWRDTAANPDPRRTRTGERAMQQFASFKPWDGGFMQRVELAHPDQTVRLSAYAHGWARHDGDPGCNDDGCWSKPCGREPGYMLLSDFRAGAPLPPESLPEATRDDWRSLLFLVGIDPTGGEDPLSAAVVWGDGAFIYNVYREVPPVEVTALGDHITVYLRCRCLWPFRNADAYWDDASLIVVGEEPPEPPDEGHSKTGGYFLKPAPGQAGFAQQRVSVIVLQDDYGLAGQVMNGTLLIGRKVCQYDAQFQRAQGMTPQDAAAQFVLDQMHTYQANPAIRYWIGHNEPVWATWDEMSWYAGFEIHRMRQMADFDLKCVIGGFASGTPPMKLWSAFYPAIAEGLRYQAVLGLHEYANTWMWWMTNGYQVDPNEDIGDEGYTTLRYRTVYRQHIIPTLSQLGLPIIPLVITETGLDPNVGPAPPGLDTPGGPWKKMGAFWADHDGEPDKADYYFRQLAWYDRELQKDAYVVGCTPFTWGSYGAPWSDFDIASTPVADKLTAYVRDNPARPFVYPEAAPPEPPVEDGDPRIDYPRVYNVIPEDATEEEAAAVFLEGWRRSRETAGGSYDDAGVGRLTDRTANLYGIAEAERPAYLDFYRAWYPGAKVRFIDLPGTVPPAPDVPWSADISGQLPHNPGPYTNPYLIETGGWWTRSYSQINGLTVHHTASPSTPQAVAANHIQRDGGTPSIHYHIWVEPDGTVLKVATFSDATWHDHTGHRNTHVGMVLNGALHLARPSDAQLQAAVKLAAWFVHYGAMNITYETVKGHMDYTQTVCPGWTAAGWRDDFYRLLAEELGQAPPQPPDDFPIRGVHDEPGGDWLRSQGLQGWCVVPAYLNLDAHTFDFQHLADAGVRVIVRLNYSFATADGGQGTMPGPDKLGAFERACVDTINGSLGIWGWLYANEYNNQREHPKGFEITPQYYVDSYNRIRGGALLDVRLAPGAIDPYNVESAAWYDWRVTWGQVLAEIDGADFLALHAYCHGPGPDIDQIWHYKTFGSDPIADVYYDMRVLESQQTVIPARFAALPQIVTECNHFMRRDGQVGWDQDAGNWVREAYRYFRTRGVKAVALFRFNADQWRFGENQEVLDALREVG